MTVTIPEKITPALIRRACDALIARGCTIERVKAGATALGADPAAAPAYTVRHGRQVLAQAISARELVELAAEAAGEAGGD